MRALFSRIETPLVTPQDLSLTIHIAETGATYKENAIIKARAYAQASGLTVIADDTGLEVDVLGGAPGLFSARFSPKPNATDADRRALLLEKLHGLPRPWTARFTCTMALAHPDGRIFSTAGICKGEISPVERGTTGFGYDQIFLIHSLNLTMAEAGMREKNQISHRSHAAQKMLDILSTL